MFEIQTNDHHYVAKSIFLGALILVLGITTWTNVFAQRVIQKTSLPKNLEISVINDDPPIDDDYIMQYGSADVHEGDSEGNIVIEGEISYDVVSTKESLYSGLVTPTTSGASTTTGVVSGAVDNYIEDIAIIYARKIEALIAVKGQETRMNMLATMNKFIDRYSFDHPMYRTITRMVDIITLGDVAYKLKYCTQYEGAYILELFGMPLDIYSTIRYDSQLQKCQITYQYPDKSVHTCRLNEEQKVLLSRAMKQKQGLNSFDPNIVFEAIVEGFLEQSVCFESQKPIIIIEGTGSILSGSTLSGSISTGKTVTSWWRNRGK